MAYHSKRSTQKKLSLSKIPTRVMEQVVFQFLTWPVISVMLLSGVLHPKMTLDKIKDDQVALFVNLYKQCVSLHVADPIERKNNTRIMAFVASSAAQIQTLLSFSYNSEIAPPLSNYVNNAKLDNLGQLAFSHHLLSDMSPFLKCKNLTVFSLEHLKLNKSEVETICKILENNRNLTVLRLIDTIANGNLLASFIKYLSNHTKLQKIHIEMENVVFDNSEILPTFFKNQTQLKVLKLHGFYPYDIPKMMQTLSGLKLRSLNIDVRAYVEFHDIIQKMTTLTSLAVSGVSRMFEHASIGKLTNLKELHLANCDSHIHGDAIQKMLPSLNLESFSISDNTWEDFNSMHSVFHGLKTQTNLQSLSIVAGTSGTIYVDTLCECISGLTRIKSIKLKNIKTSCMDSVIRVLDGFKGLTDLNLEYLRIVGTKKSSISTDDRFREILPFFK